MTPAAAALRIYTATAPAVPFRDFVWWFIEHGGCVSVPDAFILALPVRRDTPEHALRDLSSPLHFQGEADTWHIYLAAGNLARLANLRHLRPLPFVSWFRRDSGRLRILPSARLSAYDQSKNPGHPAAASGATSGIRRLRP